jgi:hypothetical protein
MRPLAHAHCKLWPPSHYVDHFADEVPPGRAAGLERPGIELVGGHAAGADLRLAPALGAGRLHPPVVEARGERGQRLVAEFCEPPLGRRAAGRGILQPGLREAARHDGRERGAGRIQVNAAGQVEFELETPWRDGTTHRVMSPLEFMQRLAALVPRPRLHLVRYNACGAVAVGTAGMQGWYGGASRTQAAQPALQQRRQAGGTECRVERLACT